MSNSGGHFSGHPRNSPIGHDHSDSIEVRGVPKGAPSRQQRRAQEKQAVATIRARNEQARQLAFAQRRARRAELLSLPRDKKKAFLEAEKAEKKRRACQRKADLAEQKQAFATLSPPERKAFRASRRKQRRLENRARISYVPLQVIKYMLLAALLAGLVYAGDVAYGVFFDNSAAFADTSQALSRPPQTEAPEPSATAAAVAVSTPAPTIDPYELLLSQADLDFMKDRVNILVLGIDESLERANWGTFRTDTMILVSIDFTDNDVVMLSLPRDSFVPIYGKDERDKINTAFAVGGGYKKKGFEYAMNTVSMTLGGIPVNHYVCFDMTVVKEVVNALGGLNYDVDINVNMNGRTIAKGYQHLDGQQVLDYCRQRKGDSDISRVDRQQRMIMAIFSEVKTTGQLKDIPAIYAAVTGNIYTDLTLKQISSLAAFAMNMDAAGIERYTLPGGFLNIDGTSFWGVNQYEKRDLVKRLFGVTIKVSDADHVTTLQALAAQKRAAVAAANAAVAGAADWKSANGSFLTAAEMSELNSRITALNALAAIKNPHEVASSISLITAGTDAFNTWLAALKASVTARIAPSPTPAPVTPTPVPASPTPALTPAPAPTESPETTP